MTEISPLIDDIVPIFAPLKIKVPLPSTLVFNLLYPYTDNYYSHTYIIFATYKHFAAFMFTFYI